MLPLRQLGSVTNKDIIRLHITNLVSYTNVIITSNSLFVLPQRRPGASPVVLCLILITQTPGNFFSFLFVFPFMYLLEGTI